MYVCVFVGRWCGTWKGVREERKMMMMQCEKRIESNDDSCCLQYLCVCVCVCLCAFLSVRLSVGWKYEGEKQIKTYVCLFILYICVHTVNQDWKEQNERMQEKGEKNGRTGGWSNNCKSSSSPFFLLPIALCFVPFPFVCMFAWRLWFSFPCMTLSLFVCVHDRHESMNVFGIRV